MNLKKISHLIAVLALIGRQSKAASNEEDTVDDDTVYVYDYHAHGQDWPDKFPKCGTKNQSPIDLRTIGLPIVNELNDQLNKLYTNQVGDEYGDIQVEWTGDTIKVPINKKGQSTNLFNSLYSKDRLGGSDIYNGLSFQFHAGSQHTIDGKRLDLEMTSMYEPNEVIHGFKYGALSVMFSVNDYTARMSDADLAIIDRFFDSLQLDDLENPDVPSVPFGDLMMMVDMKFRWVYKGSQSTPPCDKYVYWNILRTIYPIQQKHLDAFKSQLAKGDHNMDQKGNYRTTQKIDVQNPTIIMQQSEKLGITNWDYHHFGEDWIENYPECDTDHQSPINFLSPITDYGQSYDIYDAAVDKVAIQYWDMLNIQVNLDRDFKQVKTLIKSDNGYAGFESQISQSIYQSMQMWDAASFILHSPSEHTIDGVRFDMEIQLNHIPHDFSIRNQEEQPFSYETADITQRRLNQERQLAGGGGSYEDQSAGDYYQSSVGILFSVDNYDEISDEIAEKFFNFFDDLQLDVDDPIVDQIRLGAMMTQVDFDNRWIYKGSNTVPPCNQYVLWNVIQKVYPIKQKHVDYFMIKMLKVNAPEGNYRVTQTTYNPDVAFVSANALQLAASLISSALLVIGICIQ